MEVINKLYSTVSSTVNQLSSVLLGNVISREYELCEQISSAGPGLLWKIYKGFKRTTKQEASIFVLEKKQLDILSKDERDILLEILKRSVVQLTKLRHPRILTVQHPLEECRESIAFATEPVFASLANVLGNITNINSSAIEKLNSYKLYEIEIKYGLMQLMQGLEFLHADVKLLHKNMCPESIILNKKLHWKIFGFDYSILNQNVNELQPDWKFQPYSSTYHHLTQPVLEYMAPENMLMSTHSPASDIYALGVLIYTLYSINNKPIKIFGKDVIAFKKYANELRNGIYPNLSCIPNGLSDCVRLLLHSKPEMRPNIHDILKISYFDDEVVKTICYMDSLFQRDNLQKSKFFKSLQQMLKQMPQRIIIQYILPCLTQELANPQMIPFVLPNILYIAENCTKEQYNEYLLVHLQAVMKIEEPIQIQLILIQKIDIFLKLTSTDDIKTNILPMLNRALENDSHEIQELCLSTLPKFAAFIDYITIKNSVLPRIKKLCLNTRHVTIKVNCLVCVGRFLDHMDKWMVSDEILPFLMQITTREPTVIMGIIGIIKLTLTNTKLGITKDIIANKIIPFLMPLCIENELSISQFDTLISTLKQMVNQVEVEHRSKIEQLNSINQTYRLPTACSIEIKPTMAKTEPVKETPSYVLDLIKPINLTSNQNNKTSDMVNKKLSQPLTTKNSIYSEMQLNLSNTYPVRTNQGLIAPVKDIFSLSNIRQEKDRLIVRNQNNGEQSNNLLLPMSSTQNNNLEPTKLSAQDIIDFLS